MANDNYTSMGNQELLMEVKKVISPINQLGRKVKSKLPKLHEEIMARTAFLVDPNIQFTARLHCLEHNLVEQPTCKICGNPVEWYGKSNAFRTYCSRGCMYSDKDFWNKVQDTCEERLGTRNAFQSEIVKERIREKHRANLGVDYPMQSPVVREKSRISCMNNMGVENPSQSEEVQLKKENTTYSHYGVRHPAQNEEVKSRMVATCKRNWNVDNFSKSPLFATFHRKRIFHDNIWFDSTWEVKVYDFLKSNNLPFEYSPSVALPYDYDGKRYAYHPDFIVNDKLFEVKGDHFFRMNESTGEEEMFCPFRESEWTDEEYNWICGKVEAKHQCMLKNNVVILREKDIDNIDRLKF